MKVKRKTRTRRNKSKVRSKVRSKVSRRSTKRTTYKRRNNKKNRKNRKTTKRRNRKLRGGSEIMLFAKTVTGKSVIINIELSMTIGDAKQIFSEQEGISIDQIIMRKTRGGVDLSDQETLDSAGFKDRNDIFVYLRRPSTPGLSIEDAWPGWQFGDTEAGGGAAGGGAAVSGPDPVDPRAMGGLGP